MSYRKVGVEQVDLLAVCREMGTFTRDELYNRVYVRPDKTVAKTAPTRAAFGQRLRAVKEIRPLDTTDQVGCIVNYKVNRYEWIGN